MVLTALVLACGGGESGPELPTDGEITALSYNVHGLPSAITGDDTEARMVQIAPLLAPFDLVGLQEDFDDDHHATLAAGTQHATKVRFADLVEEARFYGPGLAVFSHADAVHTHHEHFSTCHGLLDSSSDCLASKGFQAIRLQLGPDPSHTVDVYNTHLEAGGGAEDDAARAVHVDELLAAMSTLGGGGGVSEGQAILFLADTNLHDDDPEDLVEITRLLDGAGLSELCIDVDCPEPGRIDRILYRSSEAVELTGLDWWVVEGFVDGEGVALSDHDPIAGRIGWVARP